MGNEVEEQLDRWGSPFTKENEPREVVRLAILVRQRIKLTVPIRDAVFEVLAALRAASIKEFFLMQPGNRPLALKDADRWVMPPSMTSSGILKGFKRTYKLGWFHDTGPDWLTSDDDEWTAGAAGRRWCLQECWLFTAKRVDDLDEDLAGRIAILKTDAQRLFDFDDTPVVHQLRPSQAAVADLNEGVASHLAILTSDANRLFVRPPLIAVVSSLKPSHVPGVKWKSEQLADVLAKHRDLTDGPRRLPKGVADTELADAMSMSTSNVKQLRSRAIKAEKELEKRQLLSVKTRTK